ncbi:hypothetical protein [Chryseobacterium sp. RLHN22]|uniref:hypothetical protein n=1 Tax=Chryseobacterium sp. RLHN22 TaxID=3437885 RepID=UPI003D9B370E
MKKLIGALLLVTSATLSAQENNPVKRTFFGIQAGLFGANIYSESLISEQFGIRGEVNFESSLWGGDLYSKTGFALTPQISVSAKWYYNMTKRKNNEDNVRYNSANYFSGKLAFTPDWFVISNVDGLQINPMISFVPTYGIRRSFAKHFNYEFQVGLGIGKILKKDYDVQAVPNLSLRVGYDF